MNVDECYSFINTNGKRINDEWYDDAWEFEEGFAKVKKIELGWNFINTEGQYLFKEWYDDAWRFKNGFARVKKKWFRLEFY